MKQMITLSEGNRRALLSLPQYNPEDIEKAMQMENAALVMCGGLLGSCFLLGGCIEDRMRAVLYMLGQHSWYRHQLKKAFKDAHRKLQEHLTQSKCCSNTSNEFMDEMINSTYGLLQADMDNLEKFVNIETLRYDIPHRELFVKMFAIKILFRGVKVIYRDRIASMRKVYPAYYETWYSNAAMDGPAKLWDKALDMWAERYMKEGISLVDNKSINTCMQIILDKIDSQSIADRAGEIASEYAEDKGDSAGIFNEALEILRMG